MLPIDISNLVKIVDFRRKSSMQAEDLVFDFSRNRQTLEELSKQLPDEVSSIFFETLIIEAIQFVDLPVLVVASENGYSVLMLYFQQDHVEESLNTVEPTVYIIAHEKIVGRLHKKINTGSFPQI